MALPARSDWQDSVVTEQDVARVLAACDVPDMGRVARCCTPSR
jgi:hypothetical protein